MRTASSWSRTSSSASPTQEVEPFAQDWHRRDELIPMALIESLASLGVFGLTLPEEHGGLGMGKEAMCIVTEELSRGYIGVGSLLDALGDRGRADPAGRHGCAKEPLSAGPGLGRDDPHGRLHRARHRLRPRERQDARGAGGRLLAGERGQDLDHPCRPRRPDDDAGAHRPGPGGLSRPLDPPGREAPRHGCRSLPGGGPDGLGDPGAGLPGHEGIHAGLRRLSRAGREPPGRRAGPGLQAAHGDLRERPHPDGGPSAGRGPQRAGAGLGLRPRPPPVRQAAAGVSHGCTASSPGWRSRS